MYPCEIISCFDRTPTHIIRHNTYNLKTFELLVAYMEAHGDCRVPNREGELGAWVCHQRQSCPDPGQREKLDSIGFVWDKITTRWQDMFEQLVTYNEKMVTAECQLQNQSWAN